MCTSLILCAVLKLVGLRQRCCQDVLKTCKDLYEIYPHHMNPMLVVVKKQMFAETYHGWFVRTVLPPAEASR